MRRTNLKPAAPAFLTAAMLLAAGPFVGSAVGKDQGPASAACDGLEKSSEAWNVCASALPATAGPSEADAQLFYAGYWLAKSGRYAEALGYLRKTRIKNSRVLTYIGFATRKLGRLDEAMSYYSQALAKDGRNDVARAYLGEAHLSSGNVTAALDQLDRIERNCGKRCEPYRELAEAIQSYRSRAGRQG